MGETPYMACLVDWDEYLPDDCLNLKMMGWTGWILRLGGTGSKMAAEQTKRAEKLDSTYEVRYLAAQRQREKIPLNPNSNRGVWAYTGARLGNV